MGGTVGRFDDEAEIAAGGTRHGEFEQRVAVGTGIGNDFERRGSAFDTKGNVSGSGFAGSIVNADVESGVVAIQPSVGIAKLELERRRFGSGCGRRNGRCWLRLRGRRRKVQSTGAHLFQDGAVLVVEANLEGVKAVFIEREEVLIIRGAAVHDATATIHGGVKDKVSFAAVLGLDVVGDTVEGDVRIVSEEHFSRVAMQRSGVSYWKSLTNCEPESTKKYPPRTKGAVKG